RIAVDPRVCGGNGWIRSTRIRATGRSPRMRGKRRSPIVRAARGRSIPAYAGETRARIPAQWIWRVDPRVCGGNQASEDFFFVYTGRSPRMRGKQTRYQRVPGRLGSIPAYAGETP